MTLGCTFSWKDTTFNRYSDRFKALRCLTKCEVEETALADVATIELNRPEYGNVREYYDVIRFGPLLEIVTKKVDYCPFTVQVKELCLITIKPVIMSLETFVQNILVPEIIVKHEMKKSNCSYKEVSSNLYAGDLPTVFHEKILLHVSEFLNLYLEDQHICIIKQVSLTIFFYLNKFLSLNY